MWFTVNTETDRTATAPIDVGLHSDRAFADDAGDIGEASAKRRRQSTADKLPMMPQAGSLHYKKGVTSYYSRLVAICDNRPYLTLCIAMWPKTYSLSLT